MCEVSPPHQAIHDVVVFRILFLEVLPDLVFSIECFDNSETRQCFFDGRKQFSHLILSAHGGLFQTFTNFPDQISDNRQEDEDEKSKGPGHVDHEHQGKDDDHGFFQQHLQRAHDGVVNFLNVTRHTGNDISFSFFRKETDREMKYFQIDMISDIPNDSIAQGNKGIQGKVGKEYFQKNHDDQKDPNINQRFFCTEIPDDVSQLV